MSIEFKFHIFNKNVGVPIGMEFTLMKRQMFVYVTKDYQLWGEINKGAQPIYECPDKKDYVLSVNGEIYNYQGIKDVVLQDRYDFTTDSDCEVILHLYREFGVGNNFLNMLDGVFSFVLYDSRENKFLIARDP